MNIMGRMRHLLFSVFLLGLFISHPAQSESLGGLGSEKILWEANQLFNEYKDAKALEKFDQLLSLHPNHQEALYKSSILCVRIGNRFADETRKNTYYQKGLDFAQRAVNLDSSNADALYAVALSYGYLCQTGSLTERIKYLAEIKVYVDKALVHNYNHAGAWHLLGRWSYKVANLSLAEKAAGKIFMQTTFPVISNQQSLDALSKAIALDPSKLLYYYDLARVQRDADLNTECVATLQKAMDQKLMTAEDLEISRKCKILLHDVLKVRAS